MFSGRASHERYWELWRLSRKPSPKIIWKLDLKDILGCTTSYLKQTVLKSASYVKNKIVQSKSLNQFELAEKRIK